MSKTRIVGYCRESTMQQFQNGYNIDDQEKKIRKYVDLYYEEGTHTLEIIRDAASAKSLNRPGMNRLISLINDSQVDVIIIHNLDRLTRRIVDLSRLLDIFQSNNVNLISITEQIALDNPMGRFFVQLIVLVAQWEQETISSRTIRGLQESASQGNYVKSNAPLGYRKDENDHHKLKIIEDEAIIIRTIFTMRAEGKSYLDIKLYLKSCNNKRFIMSEARVRTIIKNKIYYGVQNVGNIEYEDAVPAIISKTEWDAANRIVTKRCVDKVRYPYLFTGLVICENCNQIMASHSIKDSKRVYLYQKCSFCNARINENKISRELEIQLGSKLSTKINELDSNVLKTSLDNLVEITEHLSEESTDYTTELALANQSIHEYEKTIQLLMNKKSAYSFGDLGADVKRDIIRNLVKIIYYNPHSKTIRIVGLKS